jgi:hypothetical protein
VARVVSLRRWRVWCVFGRFPCVAAVALIRVRQKQAHESPSYRLRLGSLYEKYESHAFFFETVNLCRQGSHCVGDKASVRNQAKLLLQAHSA